MSLWSLFHPRRMAEARRLATVGSFWRCHEVRDPGVLWKAEIVRRDYVIFTIFRPALPDEANLLSNVIAGSIGGGFPAATFEMLARDFDHCPPSDSVEQAMREASHAS
jgi:hypothetical protein